LKYHYPCPHCQTARHCEWEERLARKQCRHCRKPYLPPTPAEEPDAYVDQQEPPPEMADAVRARKGPACAASDCHNPAAGLDHGVPYSQGGRTSVNNLLPLCPACHAARRDERQQTWLRGAGNGPV
jgi:hypothetical protein